MKNSEQVAFYRKVSVLVKFTLNSLYVFSLVNGFRSISDIWIVLYQKKKVKVEFGDGSDWMLSKCLTHANRTF